MPKPIKIFITSWNRCLFLQEVITKIIQRTKPGSFEIIVYDNASDSETVQYLKKCLENKTVSSVIFGEINSGCNHPKNVFYSMTDEEDSLFIVTDNDIIPPELTIDWLEQLVTLMEVNPDVAVLTPQLPPVWLQGPYEKRGDIVLCTAVGNTFKICRRSAIPIQEISQFTDKYGDDGILCKLLKEKGWKVAFASNLWCFNLERTIVDYGYTKEQLGEDPRKAGYDSDSSKHNYEPQSWLTLKPPQNLVY